MQTIIYKITLGNTTLRTGKAGRLLRLTMRAARTVPVHSCQLTLEASTPLNIQPDAEVQIELGYAEPLSRVFSGRVSRVQTSITQVEVEAFSTFSRLTQAHINAVYEKESAGEMVKNILGKLKVKTGQVQPGLTFATYSFSARQSAWQQLQTLAQKCGFAFYADTTDQAVFAQLPPGKVHPCHYGVHLLDYTWESAPPRFDGVEVYGESPAGQGQSDEAAAWLTKKEVKGTAGPSSGKVLRLVDATARNPNLARTLATNYLQSYQQQASGSLRLLGAPQIRLGDGLQLGQMPVAAHNGPVRVTGVSHWINSTQGFVTTVQWEKE